MSVPAYVALEKEPDERSSSLRRQMNKETEGNGIHGKESMGGQVLLGGKKWESAPGKCGVSMGRGKEQSAYENSTTNSIL